VVVLTGGVGGAKLVLGLTRVIPAADVTAIVNTGDDFRHLGLSIGQWSVIVGALLVRPLVKWLGQRSTLLWGLGIGWVGFAIFGLAPTGWLFLLGIPLMNLWGLAGPTAQGLMSVHVTPQEQGQLQGAVQCIRGLTALVGPGLFTFVFAAAIRPGRIHLPGAPFLLAAGILLSALPVAAVVTRREA